MEDTFITNSEHLSFTLKIIENFNQYFLKDYLYFQTNIFKIIRNFKTNSFRNLMYDNYFIIYGLYKMLYYLQNTTSENDVD